jgi:hypothetical protein
MKENTIICVQNKHNRKEPIEMDNLKEQMLELFLSGATKKIKTGQRIRVDGNSGFVMILN